MSLLEEILKNEKTTAPSVFSDIMQSRKAAKEKKPELSGRELKRDLNRLGTFLVDFFAYLVRPGIWESRDFKKFTESCNSTSKCGSASIWRWKYTHDEPGNDYWQTPEESFERQNALKQFLGDCDDYARMHAYCLNIGNDPNARFVTCWDAKSGHATCKGGTETVGTFYRVNHFTENIKDIAEFWYPEWRGIRVYKQSTQDPYTLELLETHRRTAEQIPATAKNKKTRGFESLDYFAGIMSVMDPDAIDDIIGTLDKTDPRINKLIKLKDEGLKLRREYIRCLSK